jgi:hypothetical protein
MLLNVNCRSAWLELSEILITSGVSVPSWEHIVDNAVIRPEYKVATSAARMMYDMFRVHVHNEQQSGNAALVLLDGVISVFPDSPVVASQVCINTILWLLRVCLIDMLVYNRKH